LENLRAYSQVKLALADQLRIVRKGLVALGREKAEQQCAELMVKLAEDRFILAVLGQFKRGKSSLMNAIIGRELLPTGVLPLTSAITMLKYGPAERMVIRRNDSVFPEELSVSDLSAYVTEKGNPGNRKKVKTVQVELPVPFLQRGIEFVDTPGVGSSITANTATTYDFLPECDAVLFVTGVDTPMTSMELAFLNEIREYVKRIFFVVNKIDLVTDDERSEVLEFVSETIRAQIAYKEVKVFPISSGLGLAARISGDSALYEKSGLKALEDTLASFLAGEKLVSFLAAIAYKALKLLDTEVASGVFEEPALQSRAIAIEKEKSITLQADPRASALSVTGAKARLEVLYQDILAGRMTASADMNKQLPVEKESIPENAFLTDDTTSGYLPEAGSTGAEIAADLQTRTCPVCRHIAKQAFKFFAQWQYQLASEEHAQAQFARELGFCPLHTWQLLAISSPYGASVGYARLAEEISRRINENNTAFGGGDRIKRLVHNSGNCRACKLLREAEKEYIMQLGEMINGDTGRDAYRHSQGACLWHLGMLLDDTSSVDSHRFLLSCSARLFEQDMEDMRTYAMKRDALRRALQNRNEEDAYRRAIIRIVGDRSVCMPWAEDGEI
jgi:GTP-binding protein EngB required for normal cell division